MQGREYRPAVASRARAPLVPGRVAAMVVMALMLASWLAVLWPEAAIATPTPPVILVNHETQECSQVIQGDDCSWCEPPAGWEVLGRVGDVQCPGGYTDIDRPPMECRRYKTPFCCSGGAHRGDCEDMVIDQEAAICGFVSEIEGCSLPTNWQGRPPDVQPQVWACPAGWGWAQEEIACLAATSEIPEPTATVPAQETEAAWRGICSGLSCLVVAAILFGLTAMLPVWLVARQQERRLLPPRSRR